MNKELLELLNKLEQTNGNIAKEQVIKDIIALPEGSGELYLRLTLDPQIILGIAEKTIERVDAVEAKEVLLMDSHLKELPNIIDMCIKLSGNTLFEYLVRLKSNINGQEWKWIKRMLLKDLKCNVGLKMVNKFLNPKIPKFEMQLCDTIDIYDKEEVAKKLEFPCAMECKYDGIRLQVEIRSDGSYQLLSRRGTDKTEDFPEIGEALCKMFPKQHLCFDGEIITSGKRSFQSIMKKDAAGTQRIFVIFDLLNDERMPYISRYDNLVNLFEQIETSDNIVLAEHYSANNINDIIKYYEDLNERGEEGIVLKLFNRIYERGSRKYMFKCKKTYTMDLECIGYEYGTIGSKREHKVSSLNLKNKDGSIIVSVGSGFDDTMIEWLTDNRETLVGKIIEIRYNELTETGSIRFPRFICIRDDKDEAD